jgi:hypothetical protein
MTLWRRLCDTVWLAAWLIYEYHVFAILHHQTHSWVLAYQSADL